MTPRHDETVAVVAVLVVLSSVSVGPFVWPLLPVSSADVTGEPTTTDRDPVDRSDRAFRLGGGPGRASNDSHNVSVAVLDPEGFAVDNPALADRVVATRSFWEGRSITNRGRNAHGTASAMIVANVAPEADLYLANFNGSREFSRAVDWAVDRDVDVIVAPVSFYGKPNDGRGVSSRAVARAAEAGIPVVVPTGNLARRHRVETYDGEGWVSFDGDRFLRLEGGDREVELWARWNESTVERYDFEIVLFQDTGDGYRRVATSQRFESDQVGPNQVLAYRPDARLRTPVDDESYAIAVRGPPDVTARIELYSGTHRFARPDPEGSIVAPATANASGVVAVGAARRRDGRVRALPSSSHGPTNDGRRGIDLVAPGVFETDDRGEITGSSFAAAYTGGVVALMKTAAPAASPATIESTLESTALPAGPPGVDNATGHGMLDPSAAVEAVETGGDPGSSIPAIDAARGTTGGARAGDRPATHRRSVPPTVGPSGPPLVGPSRSASRPVGPSQSVSRPVDSSRSPSVPGPLRSEVVSRWRPPATLP